MKQLIMLLACLVGLAANAQYTTVINTDSLCPIIDAPILESHLSKDYRYINTPMELTINQTIKYARKIGFTDFVSDLVVENTRYRLYKARNPETGDECWITYEFNADKDKDKDAYKGVAYVFKDKKTMPKDFKEKEVRTDLFAYDVKKWKNRIIIEGNYTIERILKGKKFRKPCGGGIPEQPIRVIVVNT
mgnify:CR=1 FL=1